jgi:hypothetical protein
VVWLNDKQTVNGALMENYYDRKLPVPLRVRCNSRPMGRDLLAQFVPPRNCFRQTANKLLRDSDPAGFQSVFNGKDFEGWAGPVDNYHSDGAITCRP